MALESILEPVQWLLDRAEISDLLYRFASCLDAKDYQGYAENFVEGGYVELPEPTSKVGGTFKMYKEKMPELMPRGLAKYTGTTTSAPTTRSRSRGTPRRRAPTCRPCMWARLPSSIGMGAAGTTVPIAGRPRAGGSSASG